MSTFLEVMFFAAGLIVVILFCGWLLSGTAEPRNLGNQGYDGTHRVLYKDGSWSQRFDYNTAKDYAEMFGGTVHPHHHYKK